MDLYDWYSAVRVSVLIAYLIRKFTKLFCMLTSSDCNRCRELQSFSQATLFTGHKVALHLLHRHLLKLEAYHKLGRRTFLIVASEENFV